MIGTTTFMIVIATLVLIIGIPILAIKLVVALWLILQKWAFVGMLGLGHASTGKDEREFDLAMKQFSSVMLKCKNSKQFTFLLLTTITEKLGKDRLTRLILKGDLMTRALLLVTALGSIYIITEFVKVWISFKIENPSEERRQTLKQRIIVSEIATLTKMISNLTGNSASRSFA